MFADLKYILFWWFIILLFGTSVLPFTFNLFKKFFDKGYIFSKIIGITFTTYCIFVLGIFKLVTFSTPSIFLILLLISFLNYFYLFKKQKFADFIKLLKNNYKILIFEEILFFIILIFWSFVRGYNPMIEGLEKFMDWGFINSMLRAKYMPPADMWFAGESINYYYFGHLYFSLLTKFSGLISAITYNLSIATVCALTFVSGFSLVGNIIHHFFTKKTQFKFILIGGLFSALFLTFGGNLHAIYKISKLNIKQNNGQLVLSKNAFQRAANSYWYPDATRFIGFDPDVNDKTIHEFPIYSFVVADLHGHMNDIPIILFFIAMLLVLNAPTSYFINWRLIIYSGLTLSLAFMTNAWDFAIYGLLFAVTYFLINISLWKTIVNGLGVIIAWYIFTLPFSLNFIPMAQGIKLSDAQTPFYQLFILYGGFWLIIIPYIFSLFSYQLKNRKKSFLYTDLFVMGLFLTATLLVVLPECVYLKDIYIFSHRRANTMFKLVYQAFIIYSLITGYVLVRLSTLIKNHRQYLIYKILFLLIFVSHLIYPFFAIRSYYGLKEYKGLYGMNFLKDQFSDNLEAIDWINKNITGQPIMLEAVGDSYTLYNQISATTGLPTVQGWLVHEWLWRGGYDQPGARAADVEKIYTNKDRNEVRRLLQKYNVDYVFLGVNERKKYPALNEKNFIDLGFSTIFETGKTKIYKVIK